MSISAMSKAVKASFCLKRLIRVKFRGFGDRKTESDPLILIYTRNTLGFLLLGRKDHVLYGKIL